MGALQPLKAKVHDGRLVLDEPTDLPEGTEVELMLVDDADFDPEERARLLQAIEDGEEDIARELEETFRLLCATPGAGVGWPTPKRPTLRRILMPRTQNYIYFRVKASWHQATPPPTRWATPASISWRAARRRPSRWSMRTSA